MGASKVALVLVQGHVGKDQIQDHRRELTELVILGELDQREQAGNVFVVIDVRKPLAEAGSMPSSSRITSEYAF
jgi:hypothetical protein